MKIVEELRKDQEVQQLKEDYRKKYGKNAPPYNYDQYKGIDDYKKKLKELVK